jgi:hypothetical protein
LRGGGVTSMKKLGGGDQGKGRHQLFEQKIAGNKQVLGNLPPHTPPFTYFSFLVQKLLTTVYLVSPSVSPCSPLASLLPFSDCLRKNFYNCNDCQVVRGAFN